MADNYNWDIPSSESYYKMELTNKKVTHISQVKIPDSSEIIKEIEEKKLEPFHGFCFYITSYIEILKNVLILSEPSAYKEESPQLFYNKVPPDKMKRITGLNTQQIKCMPRLGEKITRKFEEVISTYKKWSVSYNSYNGWFKDTYEKGLSFIKYIANDFQPCNSLRTQILYHQKMMECYIGRFYIVRRYHEMGHDIRAKNNNLAIQGTQLEKFVKEFQDGKRAESEAEQKRTDQRALVDNALAETREAGEQAGRASACAWRISIFRIAAVLRRLVAEQLTDLLDC